MTGCNPYNPTSNGDRLYARGTSDTRGNLTCTLVAVKAICDAGIKLKGDLMCVYTVDEEKHGTNGAIYVLEELGLPKDDATRMMAGTAMVTAKDQLGSTYLGTSKKKGGFVDTLYSTSQFLAEEKRIPVVPDKKLYEDFINPSYLEAAINPI